MSQPAYNHQTTVTEWRQSVLWRAAQMLAMAVRQGRTTAEFEVFDSKDDVPLVASLQVMTTDAQFGVCVHEKRTGQLVCQSKWVAIDDLDGTVSPDISFDPVIDRI